MVPMSTDIPLARVHEASCQLGLLIRIYTRETQVHDVPHTEHAWKVGGGCLDRNYGKTWSWQSRRFWGREWSYLCITQRKAMRHHAKHFSNEISMGKFVMESQQCDYSDLIVECKGSLWRGAVALHLRCRIVKWRSLIMEINWRYS